MKKITLLMLVTLITIITQAQNKLLSSINQEYINATWENFYGANYEYDGNNNLISETQLLFEAGVWKATYKSIYSYNVANKVTQLLGQEWNDELKQFENQFKDTYTYSSGRLVGIESQEWINSSWSNSTKYTASYNSDNLIDVLVEFDWNGSIWINNYLTTYTYNASKKVISDIEQKWESNQWVNYFKSLYVYNSNSKLIAVEGASWDKFNTLWIANTVNTFDYVLDAAGNRISSTESGYKTDYTYDTSQLMSNFAHPFKDKTGADYFTEDFPYINKLLSETNNDGTSRTIYNYSNLITLSTTTFKKEIASITVYPNPTADFLNIQNKSNLTIDKITISDLSGKKVLEQNNSSNVDVRNLGYGIYIVQAFSGNDKFQTKFIKN